MKKGEIYEGEVERVDFPNKGIVGNCIVKNVIPGQRVRFMINKHKSGQYEGRLLEVISRAACESPAKACLHFGICGGCVYQDMDYNAQLELKASQVKKLLSVCGHDYEYEGILPSPRINDYRNKVELTFGDEYKDGPLSLGMHISGSFYDIVTIGDCRIMDKDFRTVMMTTLEYFKERNIPFFHKMRHEGYLRHLIIRKAVKTGQILVNLVTTTQMDIDLKGYADALSSAEYEGVLTGVVHTSNDSIADAVINEGTEVLYGRDHIEEELLGLNFRITPFSFFQTNSLAAEVLYEKVREYVGDTKDKIVYDLYSGTGTIAQIAAPVARRVIGVEIIEEAARAATLNAKANGLNNCEFIAGDVLKVIKEIRSLQDTEGGIHEEPVYIGKDSDISNYRPDIIILDPPRDGIHPKAIGPIIDFNADRIVYVSCKISSLSRDLPIFESRGYRLIKACSIDMVPGTTGIETCCLLERIRSAHH